MSFTTSTSSNLEEAQYIASEYFQSLDNLPNEVQHILEEIRHKDYRTQELQQEIQKDQQKYIRASMKSSQGGASGPLSSAQGSGVTQPPNSSGFNGKSHIPEKVTAAYAEIDLLAEQKIQLAERLQDLFVHTTMRLEIDLNKVRVLQGESPEEVARGSSTPVVSAYDKPFGIVKQLEAFLGEEASDGASSTPARSSQRAAVRKAGTVNSIKLPSPAPPPVPVAPAPPTRERSSRPSRSRVRDEDIEMTDLDAEGEPEEEEVEDNTPYCFCQTLSYGNMIGCDNSNCEYQWFHVACINAEIPSNPSDKWYCPACAPKMAAQAARKRKR